MLALCLMLWVPKLYFKLCQHNQPGLKDKLLLEQQNLKWVGDACVPDIGYLLVELLPAVFLVVVEGNTSLLISVMILI